MTDNQNFNMGDESYPSPPNEKSANGNGTPYSVDQGSIPSKLNETEYEPYDHRNVKHATSFVETMFHILKVSLGTGILAIPHAFKDSGYLVGTIGTVIIGIFSCYTMHMMVNAQHILCKRKKIPSITYPEIAELALSQGPENVRWMAPYGRALSFIFMVVCELGASSVYIIFVAENLKAVVDHYYGVRDIRFYMLLVFLPMQFICLIRNLKLLAPFSTMATIVTMGSFGIILYYVFSDVPSLEDRNPGGDLKELPLFFGTVMFSISAIGIIMPLENGMKSPRKFTAWAGVLNLAMLFIGIIYISFGFFGYLKYGENTAGSITLNLPSDHYLAQSVKLMLAVAIGCTVALPQYTVYDIIWNCHLKAMMEKVHNAPLYAYALKTVTFLISFSMAVLIPNLELFLSLIGSLCLPFMTILIPSLSDISVFWDSKRGLWRALFIIKHVLIFLIAVIGCYTGVRASVREILIQVFHKNMT